MRLLEPTLGIALREAVSRSDGGFPSMLVDVLESHDELVVKANVPGTTKEQLEIHYEKDILTLKAEIPAENAPEQGKFLLRERTNGSVSRTFRLPFAIDAERAVAEYQNGVLILTLPKLESAKPRQIEIH
ncbi:MAG: Hsp20/alpha crystallin family protein [Candidatus Eremiobacteraeota bacterium]|nr:Hsp20/alpha crystallin family protein [Candidatus Eremiobacteraeota bacterium]MCW5870718.1 Hsp20/alpha crystallin family protein [Candidatus Eremiobacteraeota bacterium]